MSWHMSPFVAFDTETTGTDPETARIVTAALVTVNPATGDTTTREWLADPGVDIPDEATAVHGVTTEHARTHGRPAAQVVDEIAAHLVDAWRANLPVVIYNAAYDLTLLDRELRRHHGRELDCGIVIDPLVIDKHVDRYRRGSRKLTAVAAHYGIVLSEQDAHGAAADALAAARVAWKLAHTNPGLAATPLEELHAQQAEWRAEQAASFQTYLERKGSTEIVNPAWPMHPYTDIATAGAGR